MSPSLDPQGPVPPAFGTAPLSVLGLAQWVTERVPAHQQPLAIPLAVTHHSAARTHASVALMARPGAPQTLTDRADPQNRT